MLNKAQKESFTTGIINHCKNGQTGTILIATSNNKSCIISIVKGEVVAATMGRQKGYDAAKELSKVSVSRSSFDANMKFPHSIEAKVISNSKFLNRLGYESHLKLVPQAA